MARTLALAVTWWASRSTNPAATSWVRSGSGGELAAAAERGAGGDMTSGGARVMDLSGHRGDGGDDEGMH
jgi:hypothetical protein